MAGSAAAARLSGAPRRGERRGARPTGGRSSDWCDTWTRARTQAHARRALTRRRHAHAVVRGPAAPRLELVAERESGRPRACYAAAALAPARPARAARAAARHVAHRVLGERGDRQRRVDADVRGDRRAVADEQVLVAEHALAGVDHAALGVGRDHRAAEDVRGRGDVEQRLGDRALGDPAGALGEPFGRLVGDRDERRVGALGVLFGLQPERPERAFAGAQRDRVVERLHHEDDDRAPRPVLGEQHLGEAARVQQRLGEQLQRARHARAVADEQRVEALHRVAGVAVGDGLDVGVRVGVDRGGDRDAFDQVVGVVLGHGHREDRLASSCARARRGAWRCAGSEPLRRQRCSSLLVPSGPGRRRPRRARAARGVPCAARRPSARFRPHSRRCRRRRRSGGCR